MAPAPPVLATFTCSVFALAAGAEGAGAASPVCGGNAATGVGRKCGVLSVSTDLGSNEAISSAAGDGPCLERLNANQIAASGTSTSRIATMRATGRSAPGPSTYRVDRVVACPARMAISLRDATYAITVPLRHPHEVP